MTQRASSRRATARVRIGFYFGEDKIGPGKIALLEAIAETGSISGAARALGLGYRQAWERVESLNQCLREPVVIAEAGGREGGGTSLTPFGEELIVRYARMEARALRAVEKDLEFLSQSPRNGLRART